MTKARLLRAGGATGLLVTLALVGPRAWTNLQVWWRYVHGASLRTDFTLYWIFSRIGLTQGWSHLYDPAAQRRVYNTVGPLHWFPLPYTPPMAWLTTPFALLPLHRAYVLWSLVVLVCTLVAWWLTAPGGWLARVVHLAAILGLYCVLLGLANGQVIALQMAAVAVAYRLLQRDRQVAAGAVLVSIALRPQVLLLVPFTLLLIGKRRTFVAWATGIALLGGLSVVSLGMTGVHQYVDRLALTQESPRTFWVFWQMSPPQLLSRLGLGQWKAPVILAVLVLAACVAWRHRRSGLEVPIAVGIIASLLITPFIHLQDLTVLALAAWLVLRRKPPLWQWGVVIVGYLIAREMTNAAAVAWAYPMLAFELFWLCSLALLPSPGRHQALREGTATPAAVSVARSTPSPARGGQPGST